MMATLRLAKLEKFSDGAAHEKHELRQRNLGGAIFLVAIEDYRHRDPEIYETARDFLYPTSPDWQDHFDWAISLAEGLNSAWLRDALDRNRYLWDLQRAERLARIPLPRKSRMRRKDHEGKTRVERIQTAVAVRGDRVAV